jgi:hypothetical protein
MILESVMAANTAFAIIKTTLNNGREILDAGSALGSYFKAENEIAKEASKGSSNALEAFQAKKQLEKQEDELKQMLNKQGLLGYHDFLQFKAQFARDQKEAAKVQARKKYQRQQAMEEALTLGIKVMAGLLVTMAALFGAAIYLR